MKRSYTSFHHSYFFYDWTSEDVSIGMDLNRKSLRISIFSFNSHDRPLNSATLRNLFNRTIILNASVPVGNFTRYNFSYYALSRYPGTNNRWSEIHRELGSVVWIDRNLIYTLHVSFSHSYFLNVCSTDILEESQTDTSPNLANLQCNNFDTKFSSIHRTWWVMKMSALKEQRVLVSNNQNW